ncbi:hypothetical protein SK128_014577 [Halocaridina rubra]|uniref:Fucosyltransferase n=1 Tax=Halocaridina rubra TaxID=373956 RepID=A0AAN8XG75_HALRR
MMPFLRSWRSTLFITAAFLSAGCYFLYMKDHSGIDVQSSNDPYGDRGILEKEKGSLCDAAAIDQKKMAKDDGESQLDSEQKDRVSIGLMEFQDELFAPLLSLYLRKAKGELIPTLQSFRSGRVPRILLWADPGKEIFWTSQLTHVKDGLCPLPCDITFDLKQTNASDAILIYLRNAKNSASVISDLGPRDPTQPWIMLTFEAPTLANSIHKTKYKTFNGLFNRTMMYRRDADVKLPHGFIVRRGVDAASLPQSWVIPPVMDAGSQDRKLAISFISNCKSTTSNRLQYVKNVQKYAPVDLFGKCGDKKCGHSMYVDHKYDPIKDPCLKMAGESYLFYFAFENAFCNDYATEKVYNLLHYPIVPVVRGHADYSMMLPPNSYIDANTYSPKELAERLLHLQTHPKEYQEYLEWRKYYQASTIGGERTFCHLCARLYDPDFYDHQTIDDFEDWFEFKSQCDEAERKDILKWLLLSPMGGTYVRH